MHYTVKLTPKELELLIFVLDFSKGGSPYYRKNNDLELVNLGRKLEAVRDNPGHKPARGKEK
ncbi:unnamed protein product [marine sediment metagenome]|uniref:Uncharacterized protein n=1 Tax=marine sediment metagenome TaxID=412755 RepID=X1R2P6_9ZZZZ